MKIKDLIEQLEVLDPETVVFVNADESLAAVDGTFLTEAADVPYSKTGYVPDVLEEMMDANPRTNVVWINGSF